ncbi:hypothetical protein SD70_29035 [Gordoniibacillus kamchatkensis]|uniref:DNA-binding response regulator n=1 Tax=Gordoniibacillus kamchatkensis TaxID=1590651 RepID=A0ABR5AAK0_9BACL|nr:response regulator [Paenibacillus sp. VKM B-2647]KIL38044.1 hypothetical protein SD70_29035 [Paenibacillus sp. VKM B-2647]
MISTLIVDDEKLVRKGLISTMPWEKFHIQIVGEANNGQAALDYMHKSKVDLLFADLTMPVMSGFELIEAVRADFPETLIVVLTCHQDFDYIQKAMRLGAIDYIVKTQLEQESMDEVLSRIALRVSYEQSLRISSAAASGSLSATTGKGGEESRKEKEWPALKEQWLSLQWIHNDALFDKLCNYAFHSKEDPISQGIIASLEHCPVVFNDEELRCDLERLFALQSWPAVVRLLSKIRTNLRNNIERLPYFRDIVINVVHVLRYIHQTEDFMMNRDDLAARFGMSRGYFSQCFKNIVGKSYGEYLKELQIRKAKTLIRQTDFPIYWIAEKSGYKDEKYFSKLFRSRVGMNPMEYRKLCKGSESEL